LTLGASDYINKPFSPGVVKLRVRNQLKISEANELTKLIEKRTNELSIQTTMLQTMIDSIPDVVICKDLNLKYTLINKYLAELLNIERDNVIGKGDADGLNFSSDVTEKMNSMDRQVINEDKKIIYEEWIPSADGRTLLFETIKAPIKQDGVTTGLVGIARDITEKKQMSEALKAALSQAEGANRAKSDFLATMSHEIRTSMNSIMRFAELALANEELPAQVEDYLEKIKDSTKWLLQIINDILDISKIESGKRQYWRMSRGGPSR